MEIKAFYNTLVIADLFRNPLIARGDAETSSA